MAFKKIKSRRIAVLAKIEPTEGVDSGPVGAVDAIKTRPITVTVDNVVLTPENITPFLSLEPKIIGRKIIQISFDVDWKGNDLIQSGLIADHVEIDVLLRICGMKAVYTPETSLGAGDGKVEYNPISDDVDEETATLHVFTDGLKYELVAAKATWDLNAAAGALSAKTFNISGKFVSVTDEALPSVTLVDTVARQVQKTNFTFHGIADCIQALAVSLANSVEEVQCTNDEDGLQGFTISSRDPNGSIDPLQTLEADHPFFADLVAAKQEPLHFEVGDTPGNIVEIDMPKAQSISIAQGERAGLRTYDISLSFNRDVGDDEIILTFR